MGCKRKEVQGYRKEDSIQSGVGQRSDRAEGHSRGPRFNNQYASADPDPVSSVDLKSLAVTYSQPCSSSSKRAWLTFAQGI